MWKGIVVLIIILLVTGVVLGVYSSRKATTVITSFDQCVQAKFPVLESYPPVCKTPDGRSFTQNIGNELKYHDEIQVESPRPNQLVRNPMLISGQVRGSWLFEGQFSAELFDSNNNSLGKTVLKASGNWMTDDFTSFNGLLKYANPTTANGTLKIRNDNPSGLAENQKELVMPVQLQ